MSRLHERERRIAAAWVGAALFLMASIPGGREVVAAQSRSAERASPPASGRRQFLDRYCIACHNQARRTAGLALDVLDAEDVNDAAKSWESVARKLRAGVMPPQGLPRPSREEYGEFVSALEMDLDRASVAHPNPGRTAPLHRLNRVEYQNAVRDVLDLEGVEMAALLPADDASYGFDNIGAILGLSPMLLERYLSAGRLLSGMAVGDRETPPSSDTYRLPVDLSQDRRLEGMPFGTRGGISIQRYFPVDGEYQIRFVYAPGVGTAAAESHEVEVSIDGRRIKIVTIQDHRDERGPAAAGNEELKRTIQLRVTIEAGLRNVVVAFLEQSSVQAAELLQPFFRPPSVSLAGLTRQGGYGGPYLSAVTISGPYTVTGVGETPSRHRIFTCRPAAPVGEGACADRILSALARRAYRRAPTAEDRSTLLSFYRAGREEGGFERGIQRGLESILTNLDFLFRVASPPVGLAPGSDYRISAKDLASRLSFFLWSSIPDDELLDLAEQGTLSRLEILEGQVRRMLADPRSQALTKNFAGQWLLLRNVPAVIPDQRQFQDFDENLRRAFRRETELFFDSILREDRSVLDLLRADYTFLNERLAQHYGIRDVYGSHFRRVALPDARRRGLLGQGSILTVTSYSTRTSPVLRGKWIMEKLLGTPPPPPPPDVPALEEKNETGRPLSMRAAMERHRQDPGCASCHRVMDPLGFALENFDPVGRWRDTSEDSDPVDATGVLPDGTPFVGAGGLRDAILDEPELFVRTLTEKLLTYALGRGLEYYDAPAVREIVRGAARRKYEMSSLIMGIVESLPFQMQRSS